MGLFFLSVAMSGQKSSVLGKQGGQHHKAAPSVHPVAPSKNGPDTAGFERSERANNGVVLMLPPSVPEDSVPPQLPAHTHPSLLQREDHLSRQMEQSGLGPVVLSSPYF